MDMKIVACAALLLCAHAGAQTRVETFPEDSMPVNTPALQAGVAGKTYLSDKLSNNDIWKLVFDGDGRFIFLDVPSGWKDTGKWTEGSSKICSDGKVTAVWCNEIQLKGGLIYIKTKAAGVVPMKLQ
jgi:hypothetical protein